MKRKFTFLLMALLALAGFKSWGQETITVDFESGTIPANWTLIDADGDGYNWTVVSGSGQNNSYAICSESYRQVLYPDNFLVSPQLTIGTGANISFWAYSYSNYPEKIGVAVSTTGNSASDFTVIKSWTYGSGEFNTNGKILTADLSEYADQQVYLAIRHYESVNQWRIYVDNITINLGVAGTSYSIAYDNANIQHGSISGPATAYAGQTITVTATPDAGYALEHITVNSVDYLGNTFTMPEEDVTVSATFVPGLTVNDGTVVGNNNVPFNGNQAQTYPTKSEFIIPAGDLTSMQGETISSLTFYTANNTEDNDFTNGTWDVYVKEVDYTLPGGNDGYSYTAVANMTKVYSGAMSVQNHQMTIPLTTPFVYDSKNLIISFQQTAYSSTHSEVNWIGKSEGSNVRSRGGYYYGFSFTSGPSYSSTQFLPKTTFTYTSVSCPAPTGLTASDITATGATITWNGSAESYDVAYGFASTFNLKNSSTYTLQSGLTTTSVTLSGLTAETEYKCAVKAHCSAGEESAWSDAISFLPTDKIIVDFESGIPSDWTLIDNDGDGHNWFISQTYHHSGNNCLQSESYSETTWQNYNADNFFVSPQITLGENASMSFFARSWNNSWKDRVRVQISTTDNNANSFTTTLYDDKPSNNWTEIQIDLSEYEGQNVYIAFRHTDNGQESSFIDDITIDPGETVEKFAITLNQPEDAAVGTISADYEQAPAGTTVTLSANPAFGYEFGTWTVMAGEDPVTVTNNTFEMPESDVTVTATFNELTQYNITCSQTTGGAIHAEYNGETITSAPAGTEVTLVAEANPGYSFDHFTVDDEPLSGNTFIMPESNVTVSAVFSPVYNIEISMALVGGSISQMSTLGTLTAYPAGTQVFLFASPDEDYSFQENSFIVIRSDGEIGPTVTYTDMMYSFIMPESSVTVSATFNKTAFAVSQVITPTYSGSFSVSKTAHVGIGETVTLSYFNASPGYYFDFEDVNSLVVKRNDNQETVEVNNYGNIYQFAMPTSDVTVTATFKGLPRYSVFVGDVVNGTITLDNPYQDILAGAIVYFEVEPETGYTLESITVTPEEGNPFEPTQQSWYYYFTMPSSNVTISATFRQLQSYTINYYVNGQLDRTMQCQENHFVNNDGPQNVAVPAGMTFEGWGIAEIDTYVTEKPAVLGNAEYPTQDYDLYAVLRYTESVPATSKDGETWKKVESTSDLKANDKIVLVYNSKIMCQRWNESYTNYEQTAVSVVGNEINSLPENAIEFTLVNESDNWKLKYTDWGNDATLSYTSAYQSLVPQGLYGASYDNWIAVQKGSAVIMKNANYDVYIAYSSGQDMIYPLSSNGTACEVFKLDNPFITNTYYMTSVLADGEVAANTTAKNIIITTGTVTVNNDIVLTMAENGLFRNANAVNFVFADGAELIYTGEETVNATFEKDIIGYNNKGSDGWYFIANPTDNTTVNLSGGNSYDLYTFNPAAAAEWHNEQYIGGEQIPEGNIAISRETGYLYANSADFTLKFAGELIPSGEETIDLVYAGEGQGLDCPGFNLIGNPFPCTAYISSDFDMYKLVNGSEVQISEDFTMDPCEAFFVEATVDNQEVTISTTAPTGKSYAMPIVVNSDRGETLDRAILHLEGTRNSHKFMMNPDRTNISFAKNGERFAAVSRGDETEIPMNFTADHKGSYTISFNTENFEEEYLHLIDVISGDNIDLLVTPSYTFEADADEYASRFRIVFGTTDINDDPATSSEPFVYISNGNLVINNIEGTASMQIIDMLGRIVRTETVSGSYNKPHNLKAGAYVITLDGKAQRIVIE